MLSSRQSLVRRQFDSQVLHYSAGSAMADPTLIEAVVAAAPAVPGQRVLDVACGAGFLLRAYREAGAVVFGVDLSPAMLREAGNTLGPSVPADRLIAADAACLPFDQESFDVVTCKLAMHYFPDAQRAIGEMARVCKRSGLLAVIDRVACDDPVLNDAQNRLEQLRTPNKTRVYAAGELVGLMSGAGMTVVRQTCLIQPMDFEEWMAAAGALDRTAQARDLLFGPGGEDRTGLKPLEQGGRLVIHHRTLILVGKPASCTERDD